MVFEHEGQGFKDYKSALQDLGKALLEKYRSDNLHPVARRKCCVKAQKKKHTFCPDCGAQIVKELTAEEFEDWLRELPNCTADNFGDWSDNGCVDTFWTPWNKLRDLLRHGLNEKNLVCVEKAEEVLACAAFGDDYEDYFVE